MSWTDDLITILEQDNVATLNVNLFVSSKASVPRLPLGSATLHIIETAGTSPDRTQNTIAPAYLRPGAQLTARADEYDVAKAMARAAYNSVTRVHNQFINSGWYLEIGPLQEPYDLPGDPNGQARCVFNILGNKRP